MVPKDSHKEAFSESHGVDINWNSHLERLPVAAWACSYDGKKLHLNQACRRLLGVFSANDLKDGRWNNHVHYKERQAVLDSWNEFLRSPAPYFRAQFRWTKPDRGRTVHLAVRVQRLSGGWFKGWVREAGAELALARLEELSK